MEGQELFEQLDFVENPQFEAIISDLLKQQYSIRDDFFSEALVSGLRTTLLKKQKAARFKKAAIGSRIREEIDKSIRGDFIHWIDEQQAATSEAHFFKEINALITYLNKTCFMGIREKEFHYAVYPTGTFYKRHLDVFQNDDRRRLSIVCYLNEKNWPSTNGGELVIYTPQGAVDILPLPGRMVIFDSQALEHEVKEVKASRRLSITGWLKTR